MYYFRDNINIIQQRAMLKMLYVSCKGKLVSIYQSFLFLDKLLTILKFYFINDSFLMAPML